MSADAYTIHPIAHICTDFKDKFGIPRQRRAGAGTDGTHRL